MSYTLNRDRTVAVDQTYFWLPIDKLTPSGVKLQLLTKGGIAVHGVFTGDDFYTHWTPLPSHGPAPRDDYVPPTIREKLRDEYASGLDTPPE